VTEGVYKICKHCRKETPHRIDSRDGDECLYCGLYKFRFCKRCGKVTAHSRDDYDGDRCIPCYEHNVAEAWPKEGEGLVAYALRMMEINRREAQNRKSGRQVISPKSFVRKRRQLREQLERSLSNLRKGSDPPIDTADPVFVEHMRKITEARERDFEKGPMRFIASLFATYSRACRDPEYKGDLEKHGFESRQVRPWRHGSKGREAIKDAGTTTKRKNARLAQVIKMLRDNANLKPTEIASKFSCSLKTATRDLKAAKQQ
jgi:hypothetical protein